MYFSSILILNIFFKKKILTPDESDLGATFPFMAKCSDFFLLKAPFILAAKPLFSTTATSFEAAFSEDFAILKVNEANLKGDSINTTANSIRANSSNVQNEIQSWPKNVKQ